MEGNKNRRSPYFIGIDVGTQGARVVLIDSTGEVLKSIEESFPLNEASREEQSATMWWEVCYDSLEKLTDGLRSVIDLSQVKGIAVSSTSGTVIPLDQNHEPLHRALMYSDKRSTVEAGKCKESAELFYPQGYTAFNTSSGLPKMLWYLNNFPDQVGKIKKWIHAADFITGKLSGVWGLTDYTNALKSGYDVENNVWPEYLFDELGLKREWLPGVIPSGEVIGTIDPDLAGHLGLSKHMRVAVGMTDGCASQIASGAINVGDWNTTIGTTLVVKGVTEKKIDDPMGRLYCHRHPLGYWMPGGASNTGADWITQEFSPQLDQLNEKAASLIPTSHISYPLRQAGERFPFIAPQAEGFEPEGLSFEEKFAANMEGVAYLEKYAYELISRLSGETINAVYTAGGGSNSDVWLKIRSNVLDLPVYKMKFTSGAVGAAILAASKTHFTSIIEAGKALLQIEKEVYPDDKLSQIYRSNYERFLMVMKEKKFIE